ncbi:MAG: hypothetical protein ABUL72_00050 [Armatimonadota bacterium]
MERVKVSKEPKGVLLELGENRFVIPYSDVSLVIRELESHALSDPEGQRYQNWMPDDDAHLRQLVESGLDSTVIAQRMGRSPGSIRSRRQKLHLG